MYLHFLLFFILFFITTASAGEKIYFKNGTIIETSVAEVYSRHLVDSSKVAIMLRQIDSLSTTEQHIADMFAGLDSTITVSSSGNEFIVSLTAYRPPLYYSMPTQVLRPHSLSLLFRYDQYGKAGFSYDGIVLEQWNIIHRFQGSISVNGSHTIYSSLNFAFGIGFQGESDQIIYSTVLNTGVYGGTPDVTRKSRIHEVVFISQQAGYHITGQVYCFAGIDYFFYRQSTVVPEDDLLAYLGIALRL